MELLLYGDSLDLRTFTKAFVAGLVAKDMYELRPADTLTRRGFEMVVRVLDAARVKLKEEGADKDFVRRVGRLANELRASNTGAFDGFESALRQAQLTFTSSPNPEYDDIVFSVPKAYAESTVKGLARSAKRLVTEAVGAFVKQVGWD